ncbi:MAG: 4Fe-4S binding protein, partial [Planctomycetes bacterium]|nr:4Fe-4S binding protein [Planctomycetota bacterium]
MTQAENRRKPQLWQGLALMAFAVFPAALCQLSAKPPVDRHIHVDSFRYGKEPSVIRCHRGDRLHLTFSARDTGHSFFLEEFDLDAKISPGSGDAVVFRASDPTAPPRRTREVVFKAEHSGWRRYLVSKSQYRCHVWCGPMHAFEHGSLIIEPNSLLYAGLGLLVGVPVLGLVSLRRPLQRDRAVTRRVAPTDGRDLFDCFPRLKRLAKWRGLQFTCVATTMLLLYMVILTALFGTQMAGRNFAVMLTWVVWLFLLTAVLTPLGGRIWCLACPLPAVGEFFQRGALTAVRTGATCGTNNRFFGLNRPWPKWLASDWPRTIGFLTLGTFSIVLVAAPRTSGWLILGLLVLAAVMALIWQLRAFCRYVCPVSAFVGLYAKSAKLALRAADPAIC